MRKDKILLRAFFAFTVVALVAFHPIPKVEKKLDNQLVIPKNNFSSPTELLYKKIGLEGKLDFSIFDRALEGWKNLPAKNKNIFTIVDFTAPSTAKRLFTIDIEKQELLFHSVVAHGKNSGGNYATAFSNVNGSHQSSLGFYVTENTYQGGNGYSLVLNGLEPGINDLAKQRAIVIHGAAYANESFIKGMGRLGRSFGCPALPQDVNGPIINTIKNGTLLYIHADDPNYLTMSTVVKPEDSKTRLADNTEEEDQRVL